MTIINEQEITKIAKLARIGLTDSEKVTFIKELSGILTLIEELQAVDTDGVSPMTSVTTDPLPRRKDEVTDGGIAEDIVKNAALSEYNCFVVPKVVE
jgi:aspartyl-tRNA(Asn)/glutamyl-tRNA(Gln) amidotransferase subunit C